MEVSALEQGLILGCSSLAHELALYVSTFQYEGKFSKQKQKEKKKKKEIHVSSQMAPSFQCWLTLTQWKDQICLPLLRHLFRRPAQGHGGAQQTLE